MFINYFFIPTNNIKFIKKSKELKGINNRIFDFEDSIMESDIDSSLVLLSKTNRRETDWIRIPFEENLANKIVEVTSKLGYCNYVVPKFNGYIDLKKFLKNIKEFNLQTRFIFMVENPKSLLDIEFIIKTYKSQIHGIGLGSHDFSFTTGIENTNIFLRQIRINILIICKAYGIEAIDVANMNLLDMKKFNDEILDGFKCGYRAKFIIHPNQLEALNKFSFYTQEEIESYSEILNYYEKEIAEKEAIFRYKGKVYEKMHIKQIKKIVKWGNEFYGANR